MLKNTQYLDKLRKSGLRPTRQRLKICEVLFNKSKTFHFTIKNLVEKIENETETKISLATVYNTVHAFKNKGYLIEIPINSDQSYFDTNTSHHHHFYNENQRQLIDIDNTDIGPIKLKKTIPGKKIKSIEVLVKLEDETL
tara:strand:+ start:164 stop:583 length:420 start_codon:yes stop_codon:yes gene_type:complete